MRTGRHAKALRNRAGSARGVAAANRLSCIICRAISEAFDVVLLLATTPYCLILQGRYTEAQPLIERVLGIKEDCLGADHPSTITTRAWMAELFTMQGFLDKASPLWEEVVNARERVGGRDHPEVASALDKWAYSLYGQVKRRSEEYPGQVGRGLVSR